MAEQYKGVLDWASLGGVIATVMGWLPTIAVILSIAWTSIRIYEWAVQKLTGKGKDANVRLD